MTWWESWFGEEYLDLYPHRDLAAARREAAFALAHLPPEPAPAARPVLRLGPPLDPLRRGRRATGRPRLLRPAARPRSPARPPHPARARRHALAALPRRLLPRRRQLLHELRLLPHGGREHSRSSPRSSASSRPGGAFLCDTFGRDHVSRAPRARGAAACGDKEYRIRRSWDAATSRLEKEIEVRRAGSSETFRESVRAYSCGRARRAPRAARGCASGGVWGDFDESPLGPTRRG